jgi:hypothetical protein
MQFQLPTFAVSMALTLLCKLTTEPSSMKLPTSDGLTNRSQQKVDGSFVATSLDQFLTETPPSNVLTIFNIFILSLMTSLFRALGDNNTRCSHHTFVESSALVHRHLKFCGPSNYPLRYGWPVMDPFSISSDTKAG